MRSIALLGFVCLLSAACSGKEPGDSSPTYYIQTSVTMTDGSTFEFNEPCTTSSVTIAGETTWTIDARDPSVPFGITILWKEEYITGPGTHDVNEGVMDLSTMIARAHPTDPSLIRSSSASDGTVVFEQVGYSSGDIIDGTFDNVRLDRDEPDDTVHILAVDGRFHCRVK